MYCRNPARRLACLEMFDIVFGRNVKDVMPLENPYLLFFSCGKASIKYLVSSDYDTSTIGELFTCFFASVSSVSRILTICCSDLSVKDIPK